MKGLKDFRRSLNKDRTSGGKLGPMSGGGGGGAGMGMSGAAPATLTGVKSAVTIQPPKMVIKAVTDYRSRAPQELSFQKGDFFHVISEPAPNAEWFEACNPISNARGLVPANCFDVLTKTARPGRSAVTPTTPGAPPLGGPAMGVPGPSSQTIQSPAQRAAGAAITAKGGGGLYAHVKYDFAAERDDELGAKAGEPIIVIAQSNFEWFVAKPIGRLGGPGLIPVAFVEIVDLVTGDVIRNVEELISSGVVPKVEEWKKMTAEYKKNTIPLGRFDFPNSSAQFAPGPGTVQLPPGADPAAFASLNNGELDEAFPQLPPKDEQWNQGDLSANSPTQNDSLQDELPAGMPPGEPLPVGIIKSAHVDSFHYEQGDYWFRIQASHVAGGSLDAPETAPRAPDGEERELILYRLYEDFYEFQIALLDHFPAEAGRQVDENGQQSQRILPLMPGPLERVDDYITAQRRGDLDQYIVELSELPEYILRSELVRLFFEPRPGDHCTTHPMNPMGVPTASSSQNSLSQSVKGPDHEGVEEIRTPNQIAETGYSNGTSKYAEDQPVGPGSHTRNTSSSCKSHHAQSASGADLTGRFDSLSMKTRSSCHSASNSRSSGPGQAGPGSSTSNLHPSHSNMQRNASATTVDSHESRTSGGARASAGASSVGGSSSPSFIKIKIFNRASDDLVAIRVPPNVTHAALLDKVKDRLGSETNVLRYRDANPEPGASGMVRMHDDDDLRDWLQSSAKLVLYADKA